jgi:outer membrane protein OmpA-like peptidoglycan-associated protein
MKKVFLVMMVSLFGAFAYAQDETVIEVQGQKGPYVTNGFWDNWFVTAGGGAQIYFGESDGHGSFGKRIAPALDISFGKWITPSVGVRAQYSGLQAKGWTYGKLPYSDGSPDSDGYYKEKFNTMNLHADFLWNISNAIGGERTDRFWNLVPYAGVGWARSSGNSTHKNEIALNVGLLHNWTISDAVDISIDMRSMFVNQRLVYSNGSSGVDALVSVTAGISYKMGARGFQRASDLVVIEDNTRYVEEIAMLEGMLAKAEQKRAKLMQQLESQNAELTQERNEEFPVPVFPDLAIFFEIGKATLNDKAMVNIGYVADMLKQFPDKRYVLYASADKETGTPEFNMQLSQKRGEAVMNAMVEKFGVNPEQLRIVAVGSQQQKFDKAQLNRVVVIEDQE